MYGQEHAVHQFVEGLFNIEVVGSADTARRKPAGLFVFAGPPGGGKTYLAELGAACLEICPPNCRVRDIGTTNPAHVNGAPFTERDLGDGDILEVGYTQLQIALTAHVAVRTQPCPVCGKAIELLADEPDVDRCPDCAEQARRARRSAPKTTAVQCSTCGVDLTALGNSDGRAAELHEVAVYACKQCLPSGDDLAGVTIGEYEIRQRLGEGAMGAVYLVYHRPTARILALKQMKDLHDALLVRRFEREVRLLQSLVHSNIVRYINTGIDDKGAPYLVTEYVPGGSLEDTVAARGGRLPQDHAVRLMCQVLDGLEAMHTRAIIHRDIKPQNILLRHPAGAGDHVPTPKLADFGLAVSYERAGGTRVTKPGTGLGTLMFMPPEQMCNAGAVREPADIYAVGVTLYYLLTGQYSFNFPTPAEVAALQKKKPEQWKKPQEALRMLMQLRRIMHPFHIILSEEPIAIQQRNPAIPRQLDAVVDKAVRKEARERFQSAAAFRSALLQTLR